MEDMMTMKELLKKRDTLQFDNKEEQINQLEKEIENYINKDIQLMRLKKEQKRKERTKVITNVSSQPTQTKLYWLEFLEKGGYNISGTLNFNLTHFDTSKVNMDMVKNKVKPFFTLYNQYHFGRSCFSKSNKPTIDYIGIVEHMNSNLHIHFCMNYPRKTIDDRLIYEEEKIMNTLWKTLTNSGSVWIDRIWSDVWYKYITKERNFEDRIILGGE